MDNDSGLVLALFLLTFSALLLSAPAHFVALGHQASLSLFREKSFVNTDSGLVSFSFPVDLLSFAAVH